MTLIHVMLHYSYLNHIILGTIDTDLSEFDYLMRSKNEYIVGPIPGYTIEGGRYFERSVIIEIPHCIPPEKSIGNVRVLHGTDNNFKVSFLSLYLYMFKNRITATCKGKQAQIKLPIP